MRRLFRKGREKIRTRRGFSLTETLVAMGLLSIMSAAAVLGVGQALAQRSRAIALADAQTVASTAAQVITDQLRYGRIDPGHTVDNTVVLASGTYGGPMSMTLDEGGHLITRAVSLSGGSLTEGAAYALLGADAYCGLRLRDLRFTPHTDGDAVESVEVSFQVTSETSENVLWELGFSIAPINEQIFVLE